MIKIIAVLFMVLTIMSIVLYANAKGTLKIILLIFFSVMIGIFWNKKIL